MDWKKIPVRKIAIIASIVLGVMIGLMAAISISAKVLLSPKVSQSLIEKNSSRFFDGQMSFSRASISLFRHFPRVSMDMDSLVLTYPTPRDTIAFFERYSASVTPISMLKGVLKLDDIELLHPYMSMHISSDGSSNWDSMKVDMGDSETAEQAKKRRTMHSFRLPRMDFRKMKLAGNPYIVYDDEQQDIHATLRLKDFVFDGELNTTRFQRCNFTMSVDSLQVEGRMAGDTLNFDLDHFSVNGHRGKIDIDSKAITLMATERHGRIMVPFDMGGKIDARNKLGGALSLDLHDLAMNIATVGLKTDMHLELDRRLKMKGHVEIPTIDVQDVLDNYIYKVMEDSRVFSTDMHFSAGIDVDGYYNPRKGDLPAFSASIDIPECFLRHSEFDYIPRLELKTTLSGEQGGQIDAAVAVCRLNAPGINLDASGIVSDIRGEDPLTDVSCLLDAKLDSLGMVLKQHFDILVGGTLKLDAKGKFNLSQIDKYNFANADLTARADMENIRIISYDDDLEISAGDAQLRAALMDDRFRKDVKVKDRSLGARISLNDAKFRYGKIMDIKGDGISVLLQNSSDKVELGDTLRYYPLNVLLSVADAVFKGADGFSAELKGSETSMCMEPSEAMQRIPVITIESGNETLNARFGGLRSSMKDIRLSARAEMAELHKRRRLVTMIDSLNRLHPEMRPDSIWHFLRQNPHEPKLPHFIKANRDLQKKYQVDPSVMLHRMFSRWDFNGDVTMGKTSFSSIRMNSFDAKLRLMNRCLQLTEVKALTSAGNISAEGFLSTAETDGLIHAGFNLDMRRLSAAEIIDIVPNIDDLGPVLKSFDGMFDCELAATSCFDKDMNLLTPTLDGVLRLSGRNLHFNENKTVTTIASLLWVKNASHATIKDLKVEAMLKNNSVEIFPFLLKLENWSAILAGIQNMNGSFNYHVSLVKCPFGVKPGINLSGRSFNDKMKFKLGKARYKDENIPSHSAQVNAVRDKLIASIHSVFEKGSEKVLKDHAGNGVAFDRPAVDERLEELSESERSVLSRIESD